MPVYKQNLVLDTVRGIKAFLKLEAGLTRSSELATRGIAPAAATGEVGQSRVDPAKVVWLFGTGRSGSTWLMNIMAGLPGAVGWNEPMVGKLFGDFYENAQAGQRGSSRFIFGEPSAEGWKPLVRDFVIRNAELRFPDVDRNGFVIVKEPNASSGASVLSRCMPESRMVMLVRDPRDVVASVLDGAREGSWLYARKRGKTGEASLADENPEEFVLSRARMYRKHIDAARKGFENHPGPKSLVRYEDLRADTLGTMKRIYSDLRIPVSEAKLAASVAEQDWENVPAEEKGEGKKKRKATPGGWREDLTPEQAAVIEKVNASHLEAYYPS